MSDLIKKTHRVCWQLKTGTRRGNLVSPEIAKAWVDHLSKEYPTIPHWAQDCREEILASRCPGSSINFANRGLCRVK